MKTRRPWSSTLEASEIIGLFSSLIPPAFAAGFTRGCAIESGWRLSRPGSGVAKNDLHSTRGSAFVEDDEDDAYLRPASSSRSAAPSTRTRGAKNSGDRLVDKAAEGIGQRLEEDEPFLRTRRRVPVKKGILPLWTKTRWGRMVLVGAVLVAVTSGVALALLVRNFLENDPRFRIDTASSIQTLGNSQLTRADLLSVFGSDIGRNIFFVPLS